jgi:hypothetical protein
LNEWKLTPKYVNEEWTPEILWLMLHERLKEIEKREEIHREIWEMETKPKRSPERRHVVADTDLFKLMGINPKGNQ